MGKYTLREKICKIFNLKPNNEFQIYVNGLRNVWWITEKLKNKIQIVDLN